MGIILSGYTRLLSRLSLDKTLFKQTSVHSPHDMGPKSTMPNIRHVVKNAKNDRLANHLSTRCSTLNNMHVSICTRLENFDVRYYKIHM